MTFSLGSTPRSLVKYNDQSISAITEIASGAKDDLVLIETITASSDSTIEFDSGIDDTYPTYVIKYINVHPQTDNKDFRVNFRDGSSAYDATKSTTVVSTQHNEGDTNAEVGYSASFDLAQSTAVQVLAEAVGNGNDECVSGELTLFNPSSTTFVKNFLAQTNNYYKDNFIMKFWVAGYCNVTAAIDGVQFTFESGNIDSGTIKMYGMKDS